MAELLGSRVHPGRQGLMSSNHCHQVCSCQNADGHHQELWSDNLLVQGSKLRMKTATDLLCHHSGTRDVAGAGVQRMVVASEGGGWCTI